MTIDTPQHIQKNEYVETLKFGISMWDKKNRKEIEYKYGMPLEMKRTWNRKKAPFESLRFAIKRNIITNTFQFAFEPFESIFSPRMGRLISDSLFTKINLNGNIPKKLEEGKVFPNSTFQGFYGGSSFLTKKTDFSKIWPITFGAKNNSEFKINLVAHNSLNNRTFFIPQGKTVKFKTIRGIGIFASTSPGQPAFYNMVFKYDVLSVTAIPHPENPTAISNLFRFTFTHEYEGNIESVSNFLKTNLFMNDLHPTSIEELPIKGNKKLIFGMSDEGFHKEITGKQDPETKKWEFDDGSVDFKIKENTKINTATNETEIGYGDNSIEGYMVPYNFVGVLRPKAKFSFNDNLKDIYLTTSIPINRPLLEPFDGRIGLTFSKIENNNNDMQNNFVIPVDDFQILFSKNVLRTGVFNKWKEIR